MTLPILYTFRRCPYAIRARMALLSGRQNVYIREVLLKEKPASMLALSPKGTVPVLILQDGTVLDESRDIMIWALALNNPDSIILDDDNSFITRLIDKNDSEFKYWLDRYKYYERHPEMSQNEYRTKAENFIQELEYHLKNNQYLTGPYISLADIAIFPFVRQFAYVDKTWFFSTHYENVQRWLNLWLHEPLFLNVMSKYKPWTDKLDNVNEIFLMKSN